MAIVSVAQKAGIKDGVDVKLDRRADVPFYIVSDVANETKANRLAALATLGCFYFAPHPEDPGKICTDISFDQSEEAPQLWTATAKYSSASIGKTDPSQRSQNPLDWPAELDIDYEPYQQRFEKDLDGIPILNSAGCPFESPLEEDEDRPVITITRCQMSFNFGVAEQYAGATNSDDFLGFEPSTLKIRLRAKRDNQNGIYFWRVTASLHVRRLIRDNQGNVIGGGWRRYVQDKGYQARNAAGKLFTITPIEGQSSNEPSLLDGQGGVLAQGADPFYIQFRTRPELPFADLTLL